MKYNIFKYSQRAACGFVKEVTEKGKIKTIRLDITDLAILSWFSDFYPSMWKTNINGVEYALLVHSKLRDDMPILGISKEGCRARMDKLVEFGILEYKCVKGVLAYHKENQRDEKTGTFSLYAFGPNYMRLVEDRVQGQTNEGYGFKPIRGTGSNPYGVQGQTHTKDSSTNDSSTRDSSTKSMGKSPSRKKETRHKYGEYSNVLLSDTDLAKLKEEFPTDWEERIERLSYYMESKGVSYKNHLATIRSWARKDNSYGYQRKQAPDHDWSKLDSIQPVKVLHEGEW
jgi:hypothetical protein